MGRDDGIIGVIHVGQGVAMENQQWKDAHVGVASKGVTFRATEDERRRLDDLRRLFGLTSRGQVIRLALDMLETTTQGAQMMASGATFRQAMNLAFDGYEGFATKVIEQTKNPEVAAGLRASITDSSDADADA